jgi:hypothetical protein
MLRGTSLLANVILTAFFCLATVISVYPQDRALPNDLRKSFRKFNLIDANAAAALRSENPEKRILLPTSSETFEIKLTPRDLRSARYRAEVTEESGSRPLPMVGEVATFKGAVAGKPDSAARINLVGEAIEGYFSAGSDRYFVEPARRYSEKAAAGDLVVYLPEDALHQQTFTCEQHLNDKIKRGKDMVGLSTTNELTALRVIEIATEADFEFFSAFPDAVATNEEILGSLNMVEGVYEQELGLTFAVVFQHVWSTDDPYDAFDAPGVVLNFQNNWNATRTNVARDIAHIWSAKSYASSQGWAWINVICNNPAQAYGLTGKIPWAPIKYVITAHELGHNLGADHADAAQSCGNTVMNTVLSVNTPFTFCSASRDSIIGQLGGRSCLTEQTTAKTFCDFDGDRKADVSVFRPSNGVWYINTSGNSGFSAFAFGQNGDIPVAEDYDGDGKTDAAVYRGGVWYRLKSSNGTFDIFGFGLPTDLPRPADFDGDGKADSAIFRPSDGSWHILNSGNGSYGGAVFGANGDRPVPADFDGDGKADINVYRPSNGVWYRLNSGNGSFYAAQFGIAEDKPQVGDFDGDGKADLTVFRPSNGVWYVAKSSGGFYIAAFGFGSDIPVPSDYDGDGRADLAVYRSNQGMWYMLNSSSSGGYSANLFGNSTDFPAPAR